MKFLILATCFVVAGASESPIGADSPCQCPDQKQADMILGEPSTLIEKTFEIVEDISKYRCAYSAKVEDESTKKRGNFYYRLDIFPDENSAHREFRSLVDSNAGFSGQSELKIGDEGWTHSDKENFRIVAIRIGKQLIVAKVNKLTPKASESELRKFVTSLAGD